MTQIIHNPIAWSDIESGMTPAEERFVECVGKGVSCILGGNVPKDAEHDRNVRAEVIRFFAFGGDDAHPVKGAAIGLFGARVVGELDLSDARMPYSLNFSYCRFTKAVNIQYAKCADLCLNGALLKNGLRSDGLQTDGDVLLRGGFSAEGEVRLGGAHIGGDLDCSDGNFNGMGKIDKSAIIAQSAKIDNALIWLNTTCYGIVNFAFGMAGVLVDDVDNVYGKKSPNPPPYQMRFEGFAYSRLVHPGNVESRLQWLANRPEYVKFSPLPYEQAASVLFAMGHDDDARAILLEKERERTKIASFWARVVRKVWDILVGYGYRPWKSLWWSIGVILLGAGIFYCADESGRIIPHQPVVLVNSQYLACCNSSERPTEAVARLFPDYPRFNAIVFSADVFIPFFALHQEPYWHPATDKDFISGLILWWYRAEIFFGWVLTSLFLLSITGLLRPRQHSGKG